MPATKTFSIDHATVRAALAVQRISKRDLARLCQLNENHTRRILNGHVVPGELAARKLYEGLVRLGLTVTAKAALPDVASLNGDAPVEIIDDCLNGATPEEVADGE